MIRHLLTLIWNRKRQNALLTLEIVLAFLILFAVLSFVFYNLQRYNKPMGFETEDIWVAYFNIPAGTDTLEIEETKQQIKRVIKNMPEVQNAAFSSNVTPFSGSNWITSTDDNGFELRSWLIFGDEDYADVLGINVVEGRWFNESDKTAKLNPMLVTEMMRDQYLADTTVIGLEVGLVGRNKIVGVVDNFRYLGEFDDENPLSFHYFPEDSDYDPAIFMKMQPSVGPEFEEQVNQTIRNIAKNWDFVISPLDRDRQRTSNEVWVPMIALLSICGFLVFNVALGLFGVLMYNINKRRPEIGLRRAVGAIPGRIISQFVLEIVLIASLGILVGLVFAAQIPILKVFDVENMVYVYGMLAAAAIIYILVLLCTFYPSQQASIIQPAVALHEE